MITQTAPMEYTIATISTDIVARDGRTIRSWVNEPKSDVDTGILAILMPGFGNRMHQHSSLACQLVANGITVVRFDYLNHVGISDGNIDQFTISDASTSLDATLDYIFSTFKPESVSLISTSLSARIGLRRFASDTRLSRFIAIAGVINLRRTLHHVLGEDYSLYAEEALPEFVVVDGQFVRAKSFYRDAFEGNWLATADTEMAGVNRPVKWFVGSADKWVDLQEVRASAKLNSDQCINVTELTHSGHDIGRNSTIARTLSTEVTKFCLGLNCTVVEPSYSELLASALDERRRQRKLEGRYNG